MSDTNSSEQHELDDTVERDVEDHQLAEELVERAKADGLDLVGPDGGGDAGRGRRTHRCPRRLG